MTVPIAPVGRAGGRPGERAGDRPSGRAGDRPGERVRGGPVDLRLLRLVGRHRGQLAWLIALSVVHALTLVATALAGARTVVLILHDGPWPVALLALGAALLLRAIVLRLRPVAAHRVATSVITTAREEALDTVARRGPAWVASRGARPDPVDVAGLLATGLDPLRPWVSTYLPSLVVAGVLPPVVLALMAWLDLRSMLVVALTLPLVPLFGALVGWATRRQAKAQYDHGGHLAGHFLDAVRGLATLKLVNRADRQVRAVRESSDRYARSTTRVLSVAFLSSTALDLVATLSVGLVAVGAGVRLAGGEMLLWPALAVILLAPEAYRPLREAGAQFHESAQAGAVMDQLAEFAEQADRADAAAPPVAPVAARGLQVAYPGRKARLRFPDLEVGKGELVVLSGPSGIGKTTLLRVLAGTQQAAAGRAWATGAQYVPQRPALPLARTAGEALAVEPGREREAEQVLAGLRLPVASLEAGLATPLGDDGVGLSAGQRHRLALARAVLAATGPDASSTPVLLLDEPTAHLDAHTEAVVTTFLRQLAGRGVTILAAAHRSRLLAVADRVVQLPAQPGTVAQLRAPAPGQVEERRSDRRGPVPDQVGRNHQPRLLARTRQWWASRAPRIRFLIAALAGAASMLSGIGLTVAASWLIVRAEARPPILTLSLAVVAVRAFAITRPLLGYAQRLAAHDGGLSQLATWRSQVVADLLPRVPGRLTERRGRLLGRVLQDVDQRLSGVVAGGVPLAAGVLTLTVLTGVLAALIPIAVVPVLAALAVAAVLAPVWVLRADARIAAIRDEAQSDLHDGLVGAVESADELTGQRGHQLRAVLAERSRHLEQVEATAARTDARGSAAGELGAGTLVLGGSLVAAGGWTAGTISAELAGILVLGALVATEPLLSILPAVREAAAGRRARRRLEALCAEPMLRAEPAPQPEPDPQPAPAPQPEPARRRAPTPAAAGATAAAPGLALDDVVAGWAQRMPVRGLSLRVLPGDAVLIGGESGSGKSTLAAAITGLLPLRAGRIVLNGTAIESVPVETWRSRVGLAGELDHVFASTVRQNLLLAQPRATDSDLESALHAAQLGPWLNGLSHRLDTWLDSGGRVLSGGERRRLVLARALLREPEVLLLDEPTEGLDTETARRLLSGLVDRAAASGQMLVIFSHRLEGVARVRRRYQLRDGRLQEARSPGAQLQKAFPSGGGDGTTPSRSEKTFADVGISNRDLRLTID